MSVGTPKILMRNYHSSHLLWAARHFSTLSREIEAKHTGKSTFDVRHRAYVTSSILSSAAFLEAMINELFQDAHDGHQSYIAPISHTAQALMKEYWAAKELGTDRLSILDKYQIALIVAGHQPFPKGANPYQDAQVLVRLRNDLIHFKPASLSSDDELTNLASELKKRKFPGNRLMRGAGNAYFPDHALGHGCAEWALAAATRLADQFSSTMNITPNYQRVTFPP
jgi:hypothetical protein